MAQKTLHISFRDCEIDLYNEIMRESSLTYLPIASVCKRHIRKGMKVTQQLQKLVPALYGKY